MQKLGCQMEQLQKQSFCCKTLSLLIFCDKAVMKDWETQMNDAAC